MLIQELRPDVWLKRKVLAQKEGISDCKVQDFAIFDRANGLPVCACCAFRFPEFLAAASLLTLG